MTEAAGSESATLKGPRSLFQAARDNWRESRAEKNAGHTIWRETKALFLAKNMNGIDPEVQSLTETAGCHFQKAAVLRREAVKNVLAGIGSLVPRPGLG